MSDYPHDGDLGLSPTPERRPTYEFEYLPEYDDQPSRKQLAYLRALAMRTGQTFAYPRTAAAASREIRRLKALAPSAAFERAIERHDWAGEAAAREANCDVPGGGLAGGRGPAYLSERERDGLSALQALTADYLAQAARLGDVPMAVSPLLSASSSTCHDDVCEGSHRNPAGPADRRRRRALRDPRPPTRRRARNRPRHVLAGDL